MAVKPYHSARYTAVLYNTLLRRSLSDTLAYFARAVQLASFSNGTLSSAS